ncbi:basic proline-rich protein-like [Bubalus bubalis]|uniref:basic proline-rich protein-like n=1 Tax=Bubalus bubalis TaxID=89462 RepID=UPI001E1B8156|nr:basic proline-rich protein-like [Bubalus bubalis]
MIFSKALNVGFLLYTPGLTALPFSQEASAGRDSAGAGGNFSASSAEPGSHCPGRSEHESPRPPGRCAGPGSADAPLGPGRGCAEEDAPPLSGSGACRPLRPPRAPRDLEAPRLGLATPTPAPKGLPRLQARWAAAGAWGCRSSSLSKLGRAARGRPEFRPLNSSPAHRVPTLRPPPPLLASSAPASEGGKVKEKQRPPRPGRSPRPVPLPLQAGARRLRGATRLGPDRARRASGPRAGAASKGNSTPFQPPAPPAGPAPATPPQATPAGPRSLQVPRPPRPPRRHRRGRAAVPGAEAHGEYARGVPRMNHRRRVRGAMIHSPSRSPRPHVSGVRVRPHTQLP